MGLLPKYMPAEAVPLLSFVAAACGFAVFNMAHNLRYHPEITVNKANANPFFNRDMQRQQVARRAELPSQQH